MTTETESETEAQAQGHGETDTTAPAPEAQAAEAAPASDRPTADPGPAAAEQPSAVENIAFVCYEANRAYLETIGEDTGPTWEDASDEARQAAVEAVEFTRNNPTAPLSAAHEAWLYHKRATGWRLGPDENAETKQHPSVLPYDELPPEQRVKDALFQHITRALLGTR